MRKSDVGKGPFLVLVCATVLATSCAEKSTRKQAVTPASANRAATVQSGPLSPAAEERIQREVRHELLMLPYYGVFDNLAYKVEGGTVTLYGQVTRPTLKSDAENVVKKIEGVESVTNNIKVLPLSPADDRIREAEYHAIYGQPQLFRYAEQAVPPIHIIVENGHVTLEGVVDTPADKTVADIAAKGVPGVFSVTDNLQVLAPPKH